MRVLLILILIIILIALLCCLLLFYVAMDSKLPVSPERLFPADYLRAAEEYKAYVEELAP